MNPFFKDKITVVTGAGGTLCSEIALSLARQGAKTILIGRTVEKLQTVADRIAATGGFAKVMTADVCDENAINQLAAAVEEQFGPCELLINGAGGNNIKAMTTNFHFEPSELQPAKPAESVGFFDLDMNIFGTVMQTNTLGTVIPCRAFGRQMAANGHGAILNFASMNSYRPLTRVPAYAMAKCAVVGFTEWLAVYLAPAGIRVNAVAPGFFVNERSVKYLRTPDGGLSPRGENVMHHTPMKRFGEAADLLGCVEWLLDDTRAGFVTGVTVPVDGGFTADSGI